MPKKKKTRMKTGDRMVMKIMPMHTGSMDKMMSKVGGKRKPKRKRKGSR